MTTTVPVCDRRTGSRPRLPTLRSVPARNRLVQRNRPLVIAIARAIVGTRHGELHDAIQDGLIGLLRACETFDRSLGWKFSTYASYRIKVQIHRGLKDRQGPVHVPMWVHDLRSRVAVGSVDPKSLSPSHRTCLAAAERALAFRGDDKTVPHDYRIDGDPPPGPEAAYAAQDDVRALAGWLSRLAAERPDLASVVRRRYGLDGGVPASLAEVAVGIGVSPQRVGQIEAQALRRLKDFAGVDWGGITR